MSLCFRQMYFSVGRPIDLICSVDYFKMICVTVKQKHYTDVQYKLYKSINTLFSYQRIVATTLQNVC